MLATGMGTCMLDWRVGVVMVAEARGSRDVGLTVAGMDRLRYCRLGKTWDKALLQNGIIAGAAGARGAYGREGAGRVRRRCNRHLERTLGIDWRTVWTLTIEDEESRLF